MQDAALPAERTTTIVVVGQVASSGPERGLLTGWNALARTFNSKTRSGCGRSMVANWPYAANGLACTINDLRILISDASAMLASVGMLPTLLAQPSRQPRPHWSPPATSRTPADDYLTLDGDANVCAGAKQKVSAVSLGVMDTGS